MAQHENDIAPNGLSAMGSTFAERAAYRAKAEKAEKPAQKAVESDQAENKAVTKRSRASK